SPARYTFTPSTRSLLSPPSGERLSTATSCPLACMASTSNFREISAPPATYGAYSAWIYKIFIRLFYYCDAACQRYGGTAAPIHPLPAAGRAPLPHGHKGVRPWHPAHADPPASASMPARSVASTPPGVRLRYRSGNKRCLSRGYPNPLSFRFPDISPSFRKKKPR